jgi:hypothetical protein
MLVVVAIACAAIALGMFALGGFTVYLLRDTIRERPPKELPVRTNYLSIDPMLRPGPNEFDLDAAQAKLNQLREHPAHVDATRAAWEEVYEAARRPAPPLPGDEFRALDGGWFETGDGLYRTQYGYVWFETTTGNRVISERRKDQLDGAFFRWKTLRKWKGK